ncbi:MAG: glycosyl transferase family 1, partial [Flavobacteriales bacterium]
MKSVLIITYYWPPASGPGVQRWLKFSKYLLEFGWTPVILTVENGSYVNTDKELLKDIPKELKIYQTKTLEPFLIYNALRGKKGKAIEVGMGNIKGKPSFFKRLSTYIRSNFFVPDARIGWNRFAFPKALKLIEKENIELV